MTLTDAFPRSAKYDKKWVLENSLGENVLYNAESLCKALGLRRGMRVLDLGCGKATSSIFIAKEFGCYVWAVDPGIDVHENLQRIQAAGMQHRIIPLQCDARSLPFPKGFFDAVVAVDSYMYYGANESYLPYVLQFLKPRGLIGVLDTCISKDFHSAHQKHGFIRRAIKRIWRRVHSVRWWRRLWLRTGLIEIMEADTIPESEALLREYVKDCIDHPDECDVAALIKADRGKTLKLFRIVGRLKEQ